ncbi:MAG: hypothetical protein QOH95_2470 [Gaiellaceae bacterium]|nr:hypothetical protein [Gaiellaceae bacterium]
MRALAVLRASSTWVIVAAFLLALGSIASVVTLQNRATSSRDAQVKLEVVQRRFDALQSIAYDGIGIRDADQRALILKRMRTSENGIEAMLEQLRRDLPLRVLEAVEAPYRANTATLERIRVAIAVGRRSSADPLGPVAGRSQRAVDRLLESAGIDYKKRAANSLSLAKFGSAAVILTLVTLFSIFYIRLRIAKATSERLAATDPLTGLPNRRSWYHELELALVRGRRSGAPRSVLLLDLDNFKQVNDREGHSAGDQLLETVSGCWSNCLRTNDVLGRIGGDEFAVILEDADEPSARRVVAKLHESLTGPHRASAGVAVWDGNEDVSTLMERADADMYEHKRTHAIAA